MGHSAHGKAFDEGPRERPVRMDGIGAAHFAITTKNPEVRGSIRATPSCSPSGSTRPSGHSAGSLRGRSRRAYAEALAHPGKGDREAAGRSRAAHAALESDIEKPEHAWLKPEYDVQAAELDGELALARGETFLRCFPASLLSASANPAVRRRGAAASGTG